MRIFALLLLTFLSISLLEAQTTRQDNYNTPVRGVQQEVGIQLSNLSSFGFLYKRQYRANKYIVLDAFSQGVRFGLNSNTYTDGNNFTIAVGHEHRRSIAKDNVSFIRGLGGSLGYTTYYEVHVDHFHRYRYAELGLFYKLGFNFKTEKNWNFSLEARPGLYFDGFGNNNNNNNDINTSVFIPPIRIGITKSFSSAFPLSRR